MKKLFIVRHGAYEGGNTKDPVLSQEGATDIKVSAGRIEKILQGEPVAMWSSTAARAHMTAAIISANVNLDSILDIDYHEELWADAWHKYQPEWLLDKLRAFKGDNLIVVTHMEYVDYIPALYTSKPFLYNSSYGDVIYIEENQRPKRLDWKEFQ